MEYIKIFRAKKKPRSKMPPGSYEESFFDVNYLIGRDRNYFNRKSI